MTATEEEVREASRRDLHGRVEFFVDGDIETAKAVNISETGLRFDTERPITVRLRTDVDGALTEFTAELVWARKNDDGSMAYGFRFIPDTDECTF